MCIHHNFFIHSSVNGHLDYFRVLGIVDSAAMNNGVHVSFQFWFPQGISLGVGLLGHMVVFFLFFKDDGIFFTPYSIVAVLIYIPTNLARTFAIFSISSLGLTVYRLFNDGYSGRCEVVSHCSFDLHFSNNE